MGQSLGSHCSGNGARRFHPLVGGDGKDRQDHEHRHEESCDKQGYKRLFHGNIPIPQEA